MITTHIAALSIDIDGRVMQRCCICGFKLIDSLNQAAPLNEDGTVPDTPTFAPYALVEHEEGNPSRISVIQCEEQKLPKNCCYWSLVE